MATIKVKPSSNAPLFLGEEGMAGRYIDCSANPYDLRPAADLIIQAAGRRRAELPPGTPLVILMGENHTCSAHVELQHMVAAKLLEQGQRFCVGYELSSNTLTSAMTTNIPNLGPLDSDAILDLDTGGAASLLSYITGCATTDAAPVAQRNLMAFCYENKIPSIFNDAARDYERQGGLYLDMYNSMNVAAAQLCHVAKKNDISIFGVGGIGIRNHVMARRGIDFAARQGVDIILQNTGLSHVLGRRYSNFDIHAPSLTETYMAAGAAVLPVFIAGVGYNDDVDSIPATRRHYLAQGIVIEGLAGDLFSEQVDECAEQSFITEKLHRQSGGLIRCFDAAKTMRKNIEVIQASYARILEQYYADCARHKASLTA